jgi:hypothetical protein
MATGITLGKAIRAFQTELGCECEDEDDRQDLLDKIHSGIEFMLINGGGRILREWDVTVNEGLFTLPKDLGTPVKFRFGNATNADFGVVSSAFHRYSSRSIKQISADFNDWGNGSFAMDPNFTPVEFQPPCPVRLVATTRNEKDVGKKLMVNGFHKGMRLAPTHMGHKTSGELLTIYHEEDTKKKYGAWLFDKIDGVVKDETCSYVMLSGIDTFAETRKKPFYFLSHYHPDEEVPQYAQMRFVSNNLFNGCRSFCLKILGRVSENVRYVRDEDILPITSIQMLELLAKRGRYYSTSDFNEIGIVETLIINLIRKAVAYQQPTKRGIGVSLKASGYTLNNL